MKRARILMIVSMAIFGTLGPFVRYIAVSSGELALYRAVLAACLIGLYLAVTRQPISFAALGRELPLLLFSGVAMGINWGNIELLFCAGYRDGSLSISIPGKADSKADSVFCHVHCRTGIDHRNR